MNLITQNQAGNAYTKLSLVLSGPSLVRASDFVDYFNQDIRSIPGDDINQTADNMDKSLFYNYCE